MIPSNAVGIFGGSFNPVHIGHVALVKEILARCPFERLFVIPNVSPPHKPAYETESKHRLEMVKLAFSEIEKVEISTFELDRTEPSYTFHTLQHFRKQLGPNTPIYFILGADAFYGLPEWFEFPKVLELASYIVVKRAGYENHQLEDGLNELREERLIKKQTAEHPFVRSFQTPFKTTVELLEVTLPEVSSTEIRLRLQLGEKVKGLVPTKVDDYLSLNGLYGSQAKPNN